MLKTDIGRGPEVHFNWEYDARYAGRMIHYSSRTMKMILKGVATVWEAHGETKKFEIAPSDIQMNMVYQLDDEGFWRPTQGFVRLFGIPADVFNVDADSMLIEPRIIPRVMYLDMNPTMDKTYEFYVSGYEQPDTRSDTIPRIELMFSRDLSEINEKDKNITQYFTSLLETQVSSTA